jgi:hypothetical protein
MWLNLAFAGCLEKNMDWETGKHRRNKAALSR